MCPGGEHLLPFLSPNSYSVKQSPLRDMGHGKLPHNNGAKWLTEPDRNFTILIHNYDQLNTIMRAQTQCKIFHVLDFLEIYFSCFWDKGSHYSPGWLRNCYQPGLGFGLIDYLPAHLPNAGTTDIRRHVQLHWLLLPSIHLRHKSHRKYATLF